MNTYNSLSTRPIPLQSNRVWRTYSGGKSIENWQGISNTADSDFPEEWVASTVVAKNVGREHVVEGLSKIIFQGKEVQLRDVIESAPVAFLGQEHVDLFGSNPGILVKVLDAAERLTIQVHPDVDFAQRMEPGASGSTCTFIVQVISEPGASGSTCTFIVQVASDPGAPSPTCTFIVLVTSEPGAPSPTCTFIVLVA
ncbi:MAG: type I phosphomannose isomerase catalytic subunit [Paenibacillaceae bacterium]